MLIGQFPAEAWEPLSAVLVSAIGVVGAVLAVIVRGKGPDDEAAGKWADASQETVAAAMRIIRRLESEVEELREVRDADRVEISELKRRVAELDSILDVSLAFSRELLRTWGAADRPQIPARLHGHLPPELFPEGAPSGP